MDSFPHQNKDGGRALTYVENKPRVKLANVFLSSARLSLFFSIRTVSGTNQSEPEYYFKRTFKRVWWFSSVLLMLANTWRPLTELNLIKYHGHETRRFTLSVTYMCRTCHFMRCPSRVTSVNPRNGHRDKNNITSLKIILFLNQNDSVTVFCPLMSTSQRGRSCRGFGTKQGENVIKYRL